ncbi:TRAP transporter large permease subunit [Pusillimonas sp. CC-YST705]|uniref:TRAP transporter large permease protein n=1 Tax=Mesopusillimonas faecipullorum TaxID=2755040 RepID=A0ABS8CEC3_9BURK|nr:TRAP transporter large permease subunit [Mesopusillimonas faecipullorum]MCB5364348.1 TRAP transporter large permease subunit [Mesopusillimonas faecipullorum]
MNFLSPEMAMMLMFVSVIIGIALGYYLAFVLTAVGLFFGVFLFGDRYIGILINSFFSTMTNSVLLAIPLFILMGNIMQHTGAGDRIFSSLYVLFGRLRGGLLIATNALATIFATVTGVVGASVVTVGTLSLPALLERKYDRKLSAGVICAGGGLGVLIPPSIMIVVYGPVAGVSVGSLFMAAIVPGLLLSLVYTIYVVVRCLLNPELGPPISAEDRRAEIERVGVPSLVLAIVPPVLIILAVLGSIFFGVATPTEAAAVGVMAALLLGLGYRTLSFEKLSESMSSTLKSTSMILTMTVGAVTFISTFASAGGDAVVKDFVLSMPLGPWGILLLMLLAVTILGMFLDWIGVVYLIVPLFTPIALALGFDAVWFAMLVILFLQLGYLTPPFALSVFYFRTVAPSDFPLMEMYKSIMPFIGLQLLVLILVMVYPQTVLWLPSLMSY